MSDDLPPPPMLNYAPLVAHKRTFRALPQSVAITLVICGTLLIGRPCIVAGTQQYLRDDQLGLFWASGAAGLVAILLAAFLCAPTRPR